MAQANPLGNEHRRGWQRLRWATWPRFHQHRQHDPRVRAQGTRQRLVALGITGIRFGKDQIDTDRTRLRRCNLLDQRCVHRPLPRPATDTGKARLVDRDNHNILRRWPRLPSHGRIVERQIRPTESAHFTQGGGKKGERRGKHHPLHEGRPPPGVSRS